MHHELKILPVYFEQVIQGRKPFEIRDSSDRDFQDGDTITLREFDSGHYTGRQTNRRITFVTDYAQQPGFVVFGMKPTYEESDSCIAGSLMTLNEAIAHAEDLGVSLKGECAAQHIQLAAWLKELSWYKQGTA